MIKAKHDTVPRMYKQLGRIKNQYKRKLLTISKAKTLSSEAKHSSEAWAMRREYEALQDWIRHETNKMPPNLPLSWP